jgi:hypothetical protein
MSIADFHRGAWRGLLMLLGSALAPGTMSAAAVVLPPLPGGLSAPSTPTRAPSFNLQTAAGGTLRSEDLRGKVVIARFWATW